MLLQVPVQRRPLEVWEISMIHSAIGLLLVIYCYVTKFSKIQQINKKTLFYTVLRVRTFKMA